MELPGIYFDGEDATRWAVRVSVKDGGLVLRKESAAVITWPRGSYEQVQGDLSREQLRFERGVEALVMEDRQLLILLGRRPFVYNRVLRMSGGVILVALLAGYFLGLPTLARVVARRVPRSWEQKLGQEALSELAPENHRCTDAAATAALADITARLAAAPPALPYEVHATLVTDPLVNAFATPGGYLIVNTALLARTRSPEELAGVLAHEIEHARHRHPIQGLLRAVSTSALLALLVGDATSLVGMATSVGELKYQREDETQADEDGLRRMAAAGVDPQGMIAAFHMLEKAGTDLPAQMRFLSSHPLTSERIRRLVALLKTLPAASSQAYRPLCPGTDWSKIAAACPSK